MAGLQPGTASHSLSVNPEELKLNHHSTSSGAIRTPLPDRPASTMSSMGPDLPDGAGVLRLPDLGREKMRERFRTLPPLVAPDTPQPRAAGRFG